MKKKKGKRNRNGYLSSGLNIEDSAFNKTSAKVSQNCFLFLENFSLALYNSKAYFLGGLTKWLKNVQISFSVAKNANMRTTSPRRTRRLIPIVSTLRNIALGAIRRPFTKKRNKFVVAI